MNFQIIESHDSKENSGQFIAWHGTFANIGNAHSAAHAIAQDRGFSWSWGRGCWEKNGGETGRRRIEIQPA